MQDNGNYIELLKLKRGACALCCAACTEPGNFEWDHVDPMKKTTTVRRLSRASMERIDAEVALCSLVCAPCHRVATRRQAS